MVHQAYLSFTISQSLLKLMCIKLEMPSNHLILCCPLLLLTSVFPSIRVCSSLRIKSKNLSIPLKDFHYLNSPCPLCTYFLKQVLYFPLPADPHSFSCFSLHPEVLPFPSFSLELKCLLQYLSCPLRGKKFHPFCDT